MYVTCACKCSVYTYLQSDLPVLYNVYVYEAFLDIIMGTMYMYVSNIHVQVCVHAVGFN